MGIHDDEALLSLAENFRQPHRGKLTAAEHIAEGKAGAYGGQLVRIAHKNQPFSCGNCLQKRVQQLHIHHGHLVHDDRVTF